MSTDLIARLRARKTATAWTRGIDTDYPTAWAPDPDCRDAADLIEQQAAEIARLTAALKTANDQAEHFERQWYLRGDEVDALRVDAERWRYFVTHCEWRRHLPDDCRDPGYSMMFLRLPYDTDQSCVALRNAAIDAARAAREST